MASTLLKASCLFMAASMVVAQPHGHQLFHNKRKIVTQIEVVTMQAPDMVVYVDETGNTISTHTQPTPAPRPNNGAVLRVGPGGAIHEAPAAALAFHRPASRPWPAAAPVSPPPAPQSPPPVLARPAPQPAQPYVAPAPPSYAPPANNPAPAYIPAAPVSSSGNGVGITWSPYTTKGGPCKSYSQALSEFQRMGNMNVIRVYGVDCDQVSVAMRAGAATGKKVFAGVFNLGNVRAETQQIINAVASVGNRWDLIDTISIGNEDIGNKGASVDSVARAMAIGRPMLRQAGYTGPIVHVDTSAAFMDQRNIRNGICDSDTAGDYIAANVHPFFNSQTSAANAGAFVRSQVAIMRDTCGTINNRRRKLGKRENARVRVTEAGWPKAGQANGLAVPSLYNQRVAIDSIKRMVPDLVLFSAFDAHWQDPGYLGVEPYWGILDG